MNKLILPISIFLLLSIAGFSQNADHVNRGALGFVKLGLGFGAPDDLNDDLSTTFGQNTSITGTSLQVSGGGFMLLSKRFLLGLEGRGFLHAEEEVGPYSAKLNGGNGVVKIGVALLNDTKWLGFPYLGIGYGGNRLEITNDDLSPVFFGETTVPEFAKERLRVRYPVFDIGISLFRIPAPDIDGISIGGHLGYMTSLGNDTWQMDNDDEVIGAQDMGFSAFYIKLSIGWGGFFHKKKQVVEGP